MFNNNRATESARVQAHFIAVQQQRQRGRSHRPFRHTSRRWQHSQRAQAESEASAGVGQHGGSTSGQLQFQCTYYRGACVCLCVWEWEWEGRVEEQGSLGRAAGVTHARVAIIKDGDALPCIMRPARPPPPRPLQTRRRAPAAAAPGRCGSTAAATRRRSGPGRWARSARQPPAPRPRPMDR